MLSQRVIYLLLGGFLLVSSTGWPEGHNSDRMINIDFDAIGSSPKTGPAVVGNPGDYWNPLHPVEGFDYRTDADKINDVTKKGLKYADGSSCPAFVRMINLGGGWTGNWAIHDPMFNTINYQYDIIHRNNGGPAFLYISNLNPGLRIFLITYHPCR